MAKKPDTLTDLLSAGRSDVLPGYTLTPFGLRDFADAETEFAKTHIATAAAAAVGLPEKLQRTVVEVATAQVADGRFNYGGGSFRLRALAQASTPFLLWVCLRARHPRLTRPEAAALVKPENERELYWAVREAMGFYRPEPGEESPDNRPAQWAVIVGGLRKKGLSYEDIARMTPVQVVAELGFDAPGDDAGEAAVAGARRRAQDAAFDTLCTVHGVTPEQLGQLPAETLVSCVSELFPTGNDSGVVAAAAREYAARRAAEASRPQAPDDAGGEGEEADAA